MISDMYWVYLLTDWIVRYINQKINYTEYNSVT